MRSLHPKDDTTDVYPDYIADSVDNFLTESETEMRPEGPLHLGFTFRSAEWSLMHLSLTMHGSFPVEQTAIDAGKLLTWTKGFSATNAIGNDVVRLLQDAFDRKHIHVQCSALVNDVSLFPR